MPHIRAGWAVLVIALSFSKAFATSPTFGAEMSIAISQQLLAAPPLPSLEDPKHMISPQFGFVNASAEGEFPTDTGGQFRFDGATKGNTAGLSVTFPASNQLAYYLFAVGTQVTGEVTCFQDGVQSYAIQNIKSQSLAVAAGASYRALGTATSAAALGLFAGPYYLTTHSTSDFVPSAEIGGGATEGFTFNPTFAGALFGTQVSFRMGSLTINPYALAALDFGDECKDISSDNPNSSWISAMTCNGSAGKVIAHSSFVGYGLFAGYRSFRVNVYSKADAVNPLIKVTSYSASLGYSW